MRLWNISFQNKFCFFVSPPLCYYYTFQSKSFLLAVQLAFSPTILGMIHDVHSVIICNLIEVFSIQKQKDEKTPMTLQINIRPFDTPSDFPISKEKWCFGHMD